MRINLSFIILLTVFLQVATAANGQKISITRSNATFTEILKDIKKQSGYGFIISKELLKQAKPVTIKIKDVSLEAALNECFENQPFVYQIENQLIVVSEKVKLASNKLDYLVPPINVRCKIIDEDGKSLPGATIKVKGITPVTTNADGEFVLLNLPENSILIVSYIGYKTVEVSASEKLKEIKLYSKQSGLDEVKVIAYGTTTARTSTGNISTITADEIARQPVSDILQALQGRIPGLVVKSTSGFFSGNYSVKVRGTNSIPLSGVFSVSDPLYIIDGIPLNFASGDPANGGGDPLGYGTNQNGLLGPARGQNPLLYLNPSDIESISVLKDADATAIYGSRGANGVILVTTKRAKPGKTQIDVNVFTGYSQQNSKLKLLNTSQYIAMRREALKNDGLTPSASNAYDLTVWDTTRNVDWQKELLGTARTTDGQLGFSGGDAKTTFRLNGGYHRETPPFPGDFSERRISSLLNISHSEFNGKLKTTLIANYSNTYSNLPQTDPSALILTAPNAPDIYTTDGKLNYAGWKPASFPQNFAALQQPYRANTNNFSTNLVLDYNFFKGFSFNFSGGYNTSDQDQIALKPGSSQDPTGFLDRTATFGQNKFKTWILEPTLRWTLPLKNATLQTLLGTTFQKSIIEGNRISFAGFTNDNQLEDRAAASSYYSSYSNYAQSKLQSWYARINYNLLGKYIINVNVRRDGSSRFGPGNQYGNFGSVGAAWIFSEENIVKNFAPFLSFGKLSASYGTTGGDQIGDYSYISTFLPGSSPYQGKPVLNLNNASNPDYKWTVNRKLDLTLSLGFLKDRILLTSSYYRNRTGNQLVNYTLPKFTGFSSVVDNLSALVQNEGYEFQLVTKNVQSQKFTWNTSANVGFTRNKLLSFPGLEGSTYANLLSIGEPLARQALFHYTGMNPQTGQYLFEDKNKDGQIDYTIDQDFYQTDPVFSGGIENNMQWGNISLSFFFTFTKQRGFLNAYNYIPGTIGSNQLDIVQDHWQKPGDIAKFTKYSTFGSLDAFYYGASDALWTDASYIRLQDVSVSYTLPSSFWHVAHFPRTRISLQGQNLVTFTNYKGIDPANPGLGVTLPSRRFLTARLQFNF